VALVALQRSKAAEEVLPHSRIKRDCKQDGIVHLHSPQRTKWLNQEKRRIKEWYQKGVGKEG